MGEKKSAYDVGLFYVTLFLVALGLIMVTSASQILAHLRDEPFFYLRNQAVRVALGLCVMFVCMNIPFTIYRRFSGVILLAAFMLLGLIFLWGIEVRGGTRWLHVSFLNVVLQPVEVAKLALVMFLAARIADMKGRIRTFKGEFFPLAAVSIVIALIVAWQPNISNAVLIILLSITLLFIGGCRLRHLGPTFAGLVAASVPLLMSMSHVQGRFSAFWNRGGDLQGLNWHTEQSLIALGSGFIFGCGPGRGHQKFHFLPDAHTDFIYSIIGEEFGVIGTICVLVLFVFIFSRVVRIARRSPDSFGYLLAMGLGLSIFMTAIINIAMTLGLVPTAGLPLPFISFGGSSMVTCLASMGILLNISKGGRDRSRSSVRTGAWGASRKVYASRVHLTTKRKSA